MHGGHLPQRRLQPAETPDKPTDCRCAPSCECRCGNQARHCDVPGIRFPSAMEGACRATVPCDGCCRSASRSCWFSQSRRSGGADLLIPLVEARVGVSLGRPVTIAHLHISRGRIVRVTADDVLVGNPPNWQGEPFAWIAHLTLEADAWTYIWHRQLVAPLVALDQPLVVATQTATGDANYKLQLAGGRDPSTRIGEVRIVGGHARIQLAKLRADLPIDIGTNESGGQSQNVVDAHGTYAAQPINGHLVGGALASLRDAS
jgi:hypothetical protein